MIITTKVEKDTVEAGLKAKLQAQLKKGMTQAVLLVEADAKRNCPSGTGILRSSITSDVELDRKGNVIGTVGSPLDYAPYVEYGTGLFSSNGHGRTDVPWVYMDMNGDFYTTSGQHPQPFLVPALDANKSKIADLIEEALR